jgi:hypothetical protein
LQGQRERGNNSAATILAIVFTTGSPEPAREADTTTNSDQPDTVNVEPSARRENTETPHDVRWQYDSQSGTYRVTGTPPSCPDPLEFPAPVDVRLADGILYPGQIRGTDYKPHGGFRFDALGTNAVTVRAIMDGYIVKAAKYNDGYADQVLIFFVNDCGLMVMHDHLLTLSPKLEEVLKDVPMRTDGDSRTTEVTRVNFTAGEVFATAIGYPYFEGGQDNKNVFVDFGLYDLRATNGVEYGEDVRAQYPNINEYGTHAVCWFDYLLPEEASVVRGLPASGAADSTSDYCQ